MSVDTPEQLEGLRRAGRLVAATLNAPQSAVVPGITTGELDQIAADFFAVHRALSGPILTYGYPGSICIRVDDQVVHGIPGGRTLREGELVTLDVAAELDGYHADAAITVPIGSVDDQAQRLMAATRAALSAGMRAAQLQLARADRQSAAQPGLVFTIEPMLAAGIPQILLDRDGWTVRTADHCRSAHEEHTIMVAANGPVVLTARA